MQNRVSQNSFSFCSKPDRQKTQNQSNNGSDPRMTPLELSGVLTGTPQHPSFRGTPKEREARRASIRESRRSSNQSSFENTSFISISKSRQRQSCNRRKVSDIRISNGVVCGRKSSCNNQTWTGNCLLRSISVFQNLKNHASRWKSLWKFDTAAGITDCRYVFELFKLNWINPPSKISDQSKTTSQYERQPQSVANPSTHAGVLRRFSCSIWKLFVFCIL